MRFRLAFSILVVALTIAGCSDEPRTPTESDIFNVYFYFPNSSSETNKEVYLGKHTGISACQSTASSYAASKNLSRSAGWGYICCREYKGSSCYDKYR